MAEFVELEKAMTMKGVRVVLAPGVPSPWGEALKGILHVKRIPFVRVRHDRANYAPLIRWSAQSSAPVIIYNDERPRSVWSDQLFLAERLEPNPPLIPENIGDRVLMFGLSNELCGENGFGWSRRLMLVNSVVNDAAAAQEAREGMRAFGTRYGYSAEAVGQAPARIISILETLGRQLESQQARGSRFLVGERLSALDIFWAALAVLIEPLPDNLCPLPPELRQRFTCADPAVRAATTPQLLAHRDFVYREFLELPVEL